MTPEQALYDTVHDYGAAELAAALGMHYQVLLNKANVNNPSHVPTLKDVDRIMGKTGDFRVLEALAFKHGLVLSRRPTGRECDMDAVGAMAAVMGAGSGVADSIIAMLADGKIEQREVERLAAAVFQAQQRLSDVEAAFRGMRDD